MKIVCKVGSFGDMIEATCETWEEALEFMAVKGVEAKKAIKTLNALVPIEVRVENNVGIVNPPITAERPIKVEGEACPICGNQTLLTKTCGDKSQYRGKQFKVCTNKCINPKTGKELYIRVGKW
jgi:hypothetical protein